jgi:hypothetical protein
LQLLIILHFEIVNIIWGNPNCNQFYYLKEFSHFWNTLVLFLFPLRFKWMTIEFLWFDNWSNILTDLLFKFGQLLFQINLFWFEICRIILHGPYVAHSILLKVQFHRPMEYSWKQGRSRNTVTISYLIKCILHLHFQSSIKKLSVQIQAH